MLAGPPKTNIFASSSDNSQPVPLPVKSGIQQGKKSSVRVKPTSASTPVRPTVDARSTVAMKAARKRREIIVISSGSESEDTDDIDEKQLAFLSAAAPYRIGIRLQVHKKLPFLARNLRRSFMYTCHARGVPVYPASNSPIPIQLTYRYPVEPRIDMLGNRPATDGWAEYQETLGQWRCPLCDLLGVLNTKEMLQFHLTNDHPEVSATWTKEVSVCHVL
jgi:hypothetical protein